MKINDKSKTKEQGVKVRYMDIGSVYQRVGTDASYWMKTNRGSIVCLNSGAEIYANGSTESFRFLRTDAELVVHGVKS